MIYKGYQYVIDKCSEGTFVRMIYSSLRGSYWHLLPTNYSQNELEEVLEDLYNGSEVQEMQQYLPWRHYPR